MKTRKHPIGHILKAMGEPVLLSAPEVLPQDLVDSGLAKLGKQFANGFLEGQDDDRPKIIAAMKEQGINMVLFYLDKDSPLGVQFSVWIPKCAEFNLSKFEAADTKQDLSRWDAVGKMLHGDS